MKARDAYYDNLRFFLILLVVIGHFAAEFTADFGKMRAVFIWIYSFHMPLFLFVGGLFSKKSIDGSALNTTRIFGFLTIYVVYKIVWYFLRLAFGTQGTFSLFREEGLPWYMLVMASFYVITYLVKNCKPWVVLSISIALACIAGYDESVGNVLCLSRTIVYYPFFYVGYCMNRETFSAFTKKKPVKIAGMCILLCLAVACLFATEKLYAFRPLVTGKNPFSKLIFHPELGALWRFLYYGIVAVFGTAFAAMIPHKNLGIVTAGGTRTLQIYVLHRLILYVLVEFGKMGGWTAVAAHTGGMFAWLALAVALTFALSIKPLEKPFLFLMNPMKYWKKRTA